MVGYRSSPNIVACGLYAEASRSPASRTIRVVPNIRSTMAKRSSSVRYVTAPDLQVLQPFDRVGVLAHDLVGQRQHPFAPLRILDAAEHGQAGHLVHGTMFARRLCAQSLHLLVAETQVQRCHT